MESYTRALSSAGGYPRQFKFTLNYRPESKNAKPDALSRQFSADPACQDPEPILPPTCIIGAVTWQVEERVPEAQRSAVDPGGTPPNTLYVPEPARSEVLQWGHSSRLVCHPHAPSSPSAVLVAINDPGQQDLHRRLPRLRPREVIATAPPRDFCSRCPFHGVPGPILQWTLLRDSRHPRETR